MREISPLYVEWLSEWTRLGAASARAGYIERELDRLEGEGVPLLYAALRCPFSEQTDLAVADLRKRYRGGDVYLRLIDGATPPKRDPQGRMLAAENQGKVLVAHVGERGQLSDPSTQGIETAERLGENARYGGLARSGLVHTKRGLYDTQDVTREVRRYKLDDAIVILRAWGVGMREERFRNAADKDRIQDTWLVEEIPQRDGNPVPDYTSPYDAKPQQNNKRAAA